MRSTAASSRRARARCAGASRPISSTARQCASTAARSGAKSCPLPSPPAISTTGRPRPSSATCVAATVVPFESSMNSTPPASAIRCIRCGRPSKRGERRQRRARSIFATAEASASAASAFSALCRPTSAEVRDRDEQRAAAREPDVRCAAAARAAVDESPRLLRLGHARAERLHETARASASPSDRGSSRFSTWMPPPAKMRAFAAA